MSATENRTKFAARLAAEVLADPWTCTTSSPCPRCGCGWTGVRFWCQACTNPYCPCSEPEEDDDDG